jgi:hypothetical protein
VILRVYAKESKRIISLRESTPIENQNKMELYQIGSSPHQTTGMSQAIRQPRQNTKLPPRTKSQRISLMYQANQRNLGEHIWITTGK